MTSLSAQALIDQWNNGINLVDILEIMLPQVNYPLLPPPPLLLRVPRRARCPDLVSWKRKEQWMSLK